MNQKLAIEGGSPVRSNKLPYGHQSIDEEDIAAVVSALKSYHLTTGPKIAEFESVFASQVNSKYAVAVNSGTAALHAIMFALDIRPGDEVIVSPMTFVASANCVVYQGGTPVFSDVDNDSLLLDPSKLVSKISKRTKAIIAVDYAGHPCDYNSLRKIANQNNIALISDACHSLGAKYDGNSVGSVADMSAFSFHPVKHITTGEGGLITTDNIKYWERLKAFRTHGIIRDHNERSRNNTWFYEMTELGYNYRLTDIQSALGISQLKKLTTWVNLRRAIAKKYDEAFRGNHFVKPLKVHPNVYHSYHLYIIRLNLKKLKANREAIFKALQAEGIGVNIHYIPVHFQPYYVENFKTKPGLCPIAENAYEEILSLPIFPSMSDQDVKDVIEAVSKVTNAYS